MSNEILRMTEISRSFPGVKALDDVNLSLFKGEVLALLGENGAGKSTLMKILCGIVQPDSGDIRVNGEARSIDNPQMALSLGIGVVFQELSLADNLTVAQNLFVLDEPTKFGFVDFRQMNRESAELLEELDFDVSPGATVGDLSVSQQQLVEIAKVLRRKPRILVMDEPTSALSNHEVEKLFRVIRRLREAGTGIIYISHKMDEIFQISDRVSVLRDGSWIGDRDTGSTNAAELISMMVGRDIESTFPERAAVPAGAPVILELRNATREGSYYDASFRLRGGEILGIYGLMGSGRTELAQGIYGLRPPKEGQILIDGKIVTITNPERALKHGIAYASEDRKREGLLLNNPITHNTTMASLGNISRYGFLSTREELRRTKASIKRFRTKTPSAQQRVENLSGGNQQKVVLSKCLETRPRILILDEPTRGIDIGAKSEIYRHMHHLANEGMGILMISSELPEILGVAHRVLVMRDNRIIAEVDPLTTTPSQIMAHITGEQKS